MAITLDSVLQWLIPSLIILIFVALVYSKIPGPFDTIIRWFSNIWSKLTESGGPGEYQNVLKYEQI